MAENYDTAVTMFNAYVANINTTLGWNGQGGSMQLTLVEDPKTNKIIPKDAKGNPFTGSDPKSPKVGSAVYFKYKEFYFGGIFQRWSYTEDNSSGRIYTINIESPSKLMDGVQLITGGFNGMTDYYGSFYWQDTRWNTSPNWSTNANADGTVSEEISQNPTAVVNYSWIKNIYNVFGYYENAIDGNFGNSGRNEAGMPANAIVNALQDLGQRDHPNGGAGPLMFADTEYSFNSRSLRERIYSIWGAPTGPTIDGFGKKEWVIPNCYRISAEDMSVNGFVQEMAEVLQFDYYYEVRHESFDEDEPVDGQFDDGGGLIEIAEIVVRTVNKGIPPTPNAISDYIEDRKSKGEDVSNYEVGEEFSDAVTQKIIIGGPRERYTLAGATSINPLFGKSDSGGFGAASYKDVGSAASVFKTLTPFLGKSVNGYHTTVGIPIPRNDALLRSEFPNGYYTASIFELRLARGDRNTWEMYKVFDTMSSNTNMRNSRGVNGFNAEPNGKTNIYSAPWTGSLDPSEEAIQYLFSKGFGGNSLSILTNTSRALRSNAKYRERQINVLNALWTLINNIATEYYCKKFSVPLMTDLMEIVDNPQRLAFVPGGEFRVENSWDIAGAAWIDQRAKLANEFQFMDNQGKQLPLASWFATNRYTFNNLGSSWSRGTNFLAGTVCSNGVSIEPDKYYFGDPRFKPGAFSRCIVDTGAVVDDYDAYTTADFGLSHLIDYFYGMWVDPSQYLKPGHKNLQLVIPPDAACPFALGIPEVSNRYNYGPWIGGISFKGKAEVERRDELAPALFGSWEELNRVGIEYAKMGSTDTLMTPNESGTMKVVGAPEGNVGQRFAGTGPYITQLTINVEPTGGVTTTYQFSTWTPRFGKLARYNIERIAKIRSNLFTAVRERAVEREKAKKALPGRTLEAMALPEDTKGGKNNNLTKAGFQEYDPDTIQSVIQIPAGQDPTAAGGGTAGNGPGSDPSFIKTRDEYYADHGITRGRGDTYNSDGGQLVRRNITGANPNPTNNNLDVTAMPWYDPDTMRIGSSGNNYLPSGTDSTGTDDTPTYE